MDEVNLYSKLPQKNVKCLNCAHFCAISQGMRGICQVRKNIDGKLFNLNYGKIVACNIDPVEKKPLFHFLPGTNTLSIATVGCNLRCANCQNWDISQQYKDMSETPGKDTPAQDIVKLAKANKLPSISYTYNEPTIFSEYALDVMKLAMDAGLKNIWVSNGFLSEGCAKMVIPYLDAINIDIKGWFSAAPKGGGEPRPNDFGRDEFYRKNCGAHLQPVLDCAKLMKKMGVWVEITTLSIPALSASAEMFKNIANFIYNELGPETPWHISAFSGTISWKLKKIPDTQVETLEMAYKIGKAAGLKYVYTGNVPGMPTEDTFCPKCGTLCIDRTGYNVTRHDKAGKCQKCRTDLNIISKQRW